MALFPKNLFFRLATIIILILIFTGCGSRSEKRYGKGAIYLNRGKYDEAIAEFQEALKADPTLPRPTTASPRRILRRENLWMRFLNIPGQWSWMPTS